MKKIKNFVNVLLVIILLQNLFPITAFAQSPTVFYQTDSRWGAHKYGYSDTQGTTPATISSGGCGILSYVNAVYYLTGNFIDPIFLANYSVNNGHRINGQGTAFSLYSAFSNSYGATYGFKYVENVSTYSKLISYLKNGNVAICSTPGHIMACVDYNDSNGSFLILDSYPSNNRGTKSGYAWKTQSQMQSMNIRYSFYILESISTSHSPLGNIDSYSGGTHSLNIAGWAFDADDNNAQLEIHVYLGDTCCGVLKANQLRADVNHVYGCGDYHGFGGTINLDKSIVGTQTFAIWAVGVGGGNNTHLGNITVNIESDTTGPILYHVNITQIGPTGYTVSVIPSDPSGIVRVKFPTWTEHNGQDDLITDWYNDPLADGQKSGDTYTYRVKISDHNNEYGTYYTHIYAWDQYWNQTSYGVSITLQQPDYTEVSKEFGDDFYAYIENAGAGTVLTHESTGFGNGDYDTIFTAYTKSDAQIWHFTRNEDGSYQISPKSDESLALHVVAANGACGTNVILHTATKSSAQRWFISKVDGHYFFRPACSNDCFLDLPDASLNNGVSARIWSYNGSTAQQINLGDPYVGNIVAEGTYNGYLYRIFDKNLTWTEAQAYCEQLGGNLASITSQGEQDFVAGLIGEKGKMHQYWIGARYLNGEYVWSDGNEWNYTNWDYLEPNGIRNGQIFEEYVHIYNAVNPKVQNTERFKWNDMTNGNTLETEEMFFGLHHVGFVYKAKAKCDVCTWDEGVIIEQPNYTTPGSALYTCTVCGETKTELIAPIGIPDINGDGKVNTADADALMKYITGWDVDVIESALDVNRDGEVNIRDAAMILLYLSGKI